MYNLIVKGIGWADDRDSMFGDRTFEHTEKRLLTLFKNDNQIDLEAVSKLPTVFLEEGIENEIVHFGTIISARMHGKDIALEYVYDPRIPSITNNNFREFAPELGIDNFEFSRTHWAIKDIDLYKVLLRNMQPRRAQPRVFEISDPQRIEPALVSVMMPFDVSFDPVYEKLKDTAASAKLRCRRADDFWESPAVMQDVVTLIDRSKIVIADCTNRNQNVFYEIGIAHTLGKEVILITQNENDIPFDLRHLRYIKYLGNNEGLQSLANQLAPRIEYLA